MSNQLSDAKRLVVKIGSALLVDEETGHIRREWLDAFADDIKKVKDGGTDVLVVSSGAIAVGRRHLGLTHDSSRLEEKQAAAANGQIQLAHAYQEALARHDISVAQVLLTLSDTEERRRQLLPVHPRVVGIRSNKRVAQIRRRLRVSGPAAREAQSEQRPLRPAR